MAFVNVQMTGAGEGIKGRGGPFSFLTLGEGGGGGRGGGGEGKEVGRRLSSVGKISFSPFRGHPQEFTREKKRR